MKSNSDKINCIHLASEKIYKDETAQDTYIKQLNNITKFSKSDVQSSILKLGVKS